MRTIIFVILINGLAFSQTVYEIPFATEGNEIEFEVLNDSEQNLVNLVISPVEKPDWISFNSDQKVLSEIKANEKGRVIFSFNVAKEAEVFEESLLKFQVSGNGKLWNKEIKISILPPDKFELNQNYPNPFNPTTTISYTIPASSSSILNSKVQLNIYDILGRHVGNIINEEQKPGYYEYDWSANHLASGIYIYQVSMNEKDNKVKFHRKKMLLMK